MMVSLNQIQVKNLPILLRRFGSWWLNEFLNLFPDHVAEALTGRKNPSLVIAVYGESVRLELLSGTRLLAASDPFRATRELLDLVKRFITANGLKPNDVAIGLRLPEESVFSRQLVLPAQALGAIDVIVAQDLANKTPFKTADIYSDYITSEKLEDNKITVHQWITRRQYVDQVLLSLKLELEQISFMLFGSSDGKHPTALINLRKGAHQRSSWQQKAAFGLCCSAVVFALLGSGLRYWNQQRTIDRLDAEIAAVGGKAQQVRLLIEELKQKKNALVQLRLRRSDEPGLIDLWEETTRILPSHSWLTEFRLVQSEGKPEGEISIVGFSSEAPRLVGVVDGSPLFRDAALTSPIAFDPAEGRERFALQAKVKPRENLKEPPK
jgi:general secretion pathway protein L